MGVLFLALCGVNPSAYAAWNGRYYCGYHHDHGGTHFGVVVGVPFGFPGYYGAYGYPFGYPFGPYYPGPAYYYPPAVVAVPAGPATYVQQSNIQQNSADNGAASWYYCDASHAYYPYVKECPSGWQRVAPRPPGN
jgi:hypothetical protein